MISASFSIAGRMIGPTAKPFIIAEMSGNHNHSLPQALAIVEAAAQAGADALKIQTYTPDTMTLDMSDGAFVINDPNSLWQGKSLYQLYQQAHTPWQWHQAIFARARELGMIAFSTPFDDTAVDFLESLEVPCYKIASFENTDLPLIRKVASTNKPLMISTGMASVAELDEAVRSARAAGCQHLLLLKCTSTYPASPEYTNITTIPHMRQLFGCQVGLSDHTRGVGVAVAAVALGATVIEKHFTLCRAAGGTDAEFSLEPEEMRTLVLETERAWQALGAVHYGPTSVEKSSLLFRRSIYAVCDIQPGEALTAANIRIIRPGNGLPARDYERLLGRAARQFIHRGQPLSWELV